MNEFDIIQQFFTRLAKQSSVRQSVGDDCAVIATSQFPADSDLVFSMDTLVCGRHFPSSATPYQIGTRALCTNLSDLAAMGATPLWFTLGLTLPDVSEKWLRDFSKGVYAIADRYNCDLIGGDTTQGSLTITIQVHGVVDRNQVLTRAGVKSGDALWLTGSVGDGAAALNFLLEKNDDRLMLTDDQKHFLTDRFYAPEPKIQLAQKLLPYATAAIDISDGLLADAQHMATASQVDLLFDLERIPLSSVWNDDVTIKPLCKGLEWALTGGDDYQLLFAMPESHLSHLPIDCQQAIYKVGEARASSSAKSEVHCRYQEQLVSWGEPLKKGYQHFAS